MQYDASKRLFVLAVAERWEDYRNWVAEEAVREDCSQPLTPCLLSSELVLY